MVPFAQIYGNVMLVVHNPFNRKNPVQGLRQQRLLFAIVGGRALRLCSRFSFASLLGFRLLRICRRLVPRWHRQFLGLSIGLAGARGSGLLFALRLLGLLFALLRWCVMRRSHRYLHIARARGNGLWSRFSFALAPALCLLL